MSGWVDANTKATADIGASGSPFDASGFVVNFGSGSASSAKTTGGIPQWMLIAAAVGGVLWLLHKHR